MSGVNWEEWNAAGGPKYPHEKVIQFCFRTFPADQRAGVRALDLGCGSGVHTVFLASEGFRVSAIDVSSVGVANARRRLDALGLHADLRVEGADALSFAPNSFDLVISIGVFDCTGPGIAKASVGRLCSLMAPGGRGLFLFASDRDFRAREDFPYDLHGYTRAEVEDVFSGAFSEVHVDRYITTYEGGRIEQNDWLVTVRR